MKLRVLCAAILLLVGALFTLLWHPLQFWLAQIYLERFYQQTIGVVPHYSGIETRGERLYMRDLSLTSPGGDYTWVVAEAALPYSLRFLRNMHQSNEGLFQRLLLDPASFIGIDGNVSVQGGVLEWADGARLLVDCDFGNKQGSIRFEEGKERGAMVWSSDRLSLQSVPCQTLSRLLDGSQWRTEGGTLSGEIVKGSGTLSMDGVYLRVKEAPFSLFVEHGRLLIEDAKGVDFEGELRLTFEDGSRREVRLPAHRWHLEIDHGRVSAMRSNAISLQELMDALLPAHLMWNGLVDMEVRLVKGSLELSLLGKDAYVESPAFRLDLDELGGPITFRLNPTEQVQQLAVVLNRGALLDKESGLLFTSLSGGLGLNEGQLILKDLETFHRNLRLTGYGSVNFQAGGDAQLTLHAEVLEGKLSELKQLLQALDPEGWVQAVPLEGEIALDEGGADLILRAGKSGRQIEAQAQGMLLDGVVTVPLGNLNVRDLTAKFAYAYPANTLVLRDIQGMALLERHGSESEEYLVAGDEVSFSDYGRQCMHFDVWIGDRRRDILRLVGSTAAAVDGAIRCQFDKTLTHFGNLRAQNLELVLSRWFEVEDFQLEANFQLATLLKDLQKLSRTGLCEIDQKLSQGLEELKQAEGDCYFGYRYQRLPGRFSYALSSPKITLNAHDYGDCVLTGGTIGNAWTIEQFKVGRLSLAADLIKQVDGWEIPFIGLHYGKGVLAGLSGAYDPLREQIDLHVNLAEIDIASLTDLAVRGKWKGTGSLVVDLSAAPRKAAVHASLNGACHAFALGSVTFDDMPAMRCDVSSTHGNPAVKLQVDQAHCHYLGRDYVLSPLVLSASPDELQLQTETEHLGVPLRIDLQTLGATSRAGTLLLAELGLPIYPPLLIQWELKRGVGFVPKAASGTLFGLTFDLQSDTPVDDVIRATGDVDVNFRGLRRLLPQAVADQIEAWGLRDGYRLSGRWQFSGLLPQWVDFQGELVCDSCIGKANIGEIWLVGGQQRWQFTVENVVMQDVDLSALVSEMDGVRVSQANIASLSGQLEHPESFQGSGSLQFERDKKGHAPFAAGKDLVAILGVAPELMVPVSGSLDWTVADRKVELTRLHDVYSERKLFKFSLPKAAPPATIDFDGNLLMQIRVKPARGLLKLSDKFTLDIEGPWHSPRMTKRDD